MKPTLKEIEAILNWAMKGMCDSFNSHGALAPTVALMCFEGGDTVSVKHIGGSVNFFSDTAGKNALAEFCRAALNSDQAASGIFGVLICHEAWLTQVSRENAAPICPPSQSPDRQEALFATVLLRGGVSYTHMRIADVKTRQVEFVPYAHSEAPMQVWSRFAPEGDANPGDEQDCEIHAPPTYH